MLDETGRKYISDKIQSPVMQESFFVLLQFIYIVSIRMIYLATSSRGKERLQRPQFSKSFVGWLEPGHKIRRW